KTVNIDSEGTVLPVAVTTGIEQGAVAESASQKILVVHRHGGVLERLVFDIGHSAGSWAVTCGQHSTPSCIQETIQTGGNLLRRDSRTVTGNSATLEESADTQ